MIALNDLYADCNSTAQTWRWRRRGSCSWQLSSLASCRRASTQEVSGWARLRSLSSIRRYGRSRSRARTRSNP